MNPPCNHFGEMTPQLGKCPCPPTCVCQKEGGSFAICRVFVPARQVALADIEGKISDYERAGAAIGKMLNEKQAAYGDSFGKAGGIVKILYPDGIPPSKLDDALTMIRVIDKMFRIATDRDALGEDPWKDIAGYSILSVVRRERAKALAAGPVIDSRP